MRVISISMAVAGAFVSLSASSTTAQAPTELRAPSAFAGITDQQARSQALFSEISKVLTNPRCINCHPAGDRPTQANDMHPHLPAVWRGQGVCQTCHTDENYTLYPRAPYRSIPGHPRWDIAPIEMAWQGKSISEICQQLKDPQRNGGRSLELVYEHLAHDDLVAWGWHPGEGRQPALGSQEVLGQLVRAWIDTGAACP